MACLPKIYKIVQTEKILFLKGHVFRSGQGSLSEENYDYSATFWSNFFLCWVIMSDDGTIVLIAYVLTYSSFFFLLFPNSLIIKYGGRTNLCLWEWPPLA